MKIRFFFLLLVLTFLLTACSATLDDYEQKLLDQGWDVNTLSYDEWLDAFEEVTSEDYEDNLKTILTATKTSSIIDLQIGFILEFDSSSSAKSFYETFIQDEDPEDVEMTRQKGKFVFITFSETFLQDLKLD